MDKKVQSRLQRLAFLLTQMDKLHLRDAAEILNVSEMTIRRDINNAEAESGIMLLGGYIVNDLQKKENGQYQIFEQETKYIAEKMEVGRMAASLVQDGDVVFFDCGSTIPFIASQIDPTIKFTALCCSINTFLVLQENRLCDVILCGGRYSRDNSFFTSVRNDSEIDMICTTKAFISAAGIDAEKGVTCFNFDESKTKLKAMQKTKQSILVVDSHKIGKVQQAYIADINAFDLVLCDKPLNMSTT